MAPPKVIKPPPIGAGGECHPKGSGLVPAPEGAIDYCSTPDAEPAKNNAPSDLEIPRIAQLKFCTEYGENDRRLRHSIFTYWRVFFLY